MHTRELGVQIGIAYVPKSNLEFETENGSLTPKPIRKRPRGRQYKAHPQATKRLRL